MAFPTLNAQQENRKILEEIQLKKQLLQKGGPIASLPNIPQGNISLGSSPFMPGVYATAGTATNPDILANSTARVSWNQANSQSFGFFVPQDSLSGNNILPVLPRFDGVPK